MGIFDKLGSIFQKGEVELDGDYVELDADVRDVKSRIQIRPFTLMQFDDIKHVLNAIREGRTIALVNIGPLKEKDRIGLKRAVDKLKKVLEASNGDIAGFGENWLIATPEFAKVWRGDEKKAEVPQAQTQIKEVSEDDF